MGPAAEDPGNAAPNTGKAGAAKAFERSNGAKLGMGPAAEDPGNAAPAAPAAAAPAAPAAIGLKFDIKVFY
jgi:hypothetical protein